MEEKLKISVAIDGYSSCGKSTMAKALAKELKYTYLDTGAMYRAVTFYAMENGMFNNLRLNKDKLIAALPDICISFIYKEEYDTSDTYLNDRNVEGMIRKMDVSKHVSYVSELREVRDKLVRRQREIGCEGGIIMDGRDIGTVVLPNAELKIFMTADLDKRVIRRYDELTKKGVNLTIEEVKDNLQSRDEIDTNRKEDPLRRADDAILLDTTTLTPNGQLNLALKLFRQTITRCRQRVVR